MCPIYYPLIACSQLRSDAFSVDFGVWFTAFTDCLHLVPAGTECPRSQQGASLQQDSHQNQKHRFLQLAYCVVFRLNGPQHAVCVHSTSVLQRSCMHLHGLSEANSQHTVLTNIKPSMYDLRGWHGRRQGRAATFQPYSSINSSSSRGWGGVGPGGTPDVPKTGLDWTGLGLHWLPVIVADIEPTLCGSWD